MALCLDKNRFESFPPMVRYLTRLQELSINDNTIEEVRTTPEC